MSSAIDVLVWRLTPDDWQAFREVRIASLRESPQAFSATLPDALSREDARWRDDLAARTQFVATAAGEVVGTAGGIVDRSGEFGELISMWVAPEWRGKGVSAQLIEEVAAWAVSVGFKELRLWVVEGNGRAEHAYAKAGFARTGRSQPVRPGEPAIEFEMALALSPR